MPNRLLPSSVVTLIVLLLTKDGMSDAQDDLSAQISQPARPKEVHSYIVRFLADPGLSHHKMLRTHPFAYLVYLARQREVVQSKIVELLGRSPEVLVTYALSFHGIAMALTTEEAHRIAEELPDVEVTAYH
eukprot:NODE_5212_length_705_cov_13.739329_g4843_i0.p1 GENE.NODE_5212_length_705_cov_13.739329_g4843_i0~~NODE_5212_length_705_cov_13.739329_g4843_i0.p1  ORF type:complete len:131 (+),score=19.15 NODE_5212_length_705_cov_13.739329_g4843_i0:156-548(+)